MVHIQDDCFRHITYDNKDGCYEPRLWEHPLYLIARTHQKTRTAHTSNTVLVKRTHYMHKSWLYISWQASVDYCANGRIVHHSIFASKKCGVLTSFMCVCCRVQTHTWRVLQHCRTYRKERTLWEKYSWRVETERTYPIKHNDKNKNIMRNALLGRNGKKVHC